LITTFVIKMYKIPSRSMVPTLLVGDQLVVNKFIYGIKIPYFRNTIIPLTDPQRGDIIVFIYPNDRSLDFIKRVIGIGGDTIAIQDKKIFINGKLFKDKSGLYTDKIIYQGSVQPRDNFGTVTVPKGSLFVLGDNRDESMDSRFWGFVDLKDVQGKAFIIYWSWNREENNIRWQRMGNLLH
jgi:signal peptidase I